MKGQINKFLIFAPAGIGGLVISAAGVWDSLRDQIALAFANAITALQHPLIAIGAGLFIVVYVAAIIFTNEGNPAQMQATADAKATMARQRRFLITVGRSLSNGYRRSSGNRTLLEFMQADGGDARIRPHFSKTFAKKLARPEFDKATMADALLNEMDRLEQKWKLV